MVFVEVRRKSGCGYGAAAESVTRNKQWRVVRMAVDYLVRSGIYEKCAVRFDVVAIDEVPEGTPQITLIRSAFEASGR